MTKNLELGLIGTQANIEANSALFEGLVGFATDINAFGFYDGSNWTWIHINNGLIRVGGTSNYVQISASGEFIFFGTAGLQFGTCYGNEIGYTQANAVQNTWYDIADGDMISGPLKGISHDGNGQLLVSRAGMYAADIATACEADATNVHIQLAFSVNGTEAAPLNHFETFGTSKQDSVSLTTILDLVPEDIVGVSIRTTDAGTPDLSVDHLMLRLIQIGGT